MRHIDQHLALIANNLPLIQHQRHDNALKEEEVADITIKESPIAIIDINRQRSHQREWEIVIYRHAGVVPEQ